MRIKKRIGLLLVIGLVLMLSGCPQKAEEEIAGAPLVTRFRAIQVDHDANVDGTVDFDLSDFDMDSTGSFSIDGDAASNINVAGAGIDLTLESEAGRLVLKGDEAAADAVYIDANDAVTTGLDIDVGSVSGMTVDGGCLNIGGGSPGSCGDNDLYVTADLEVDNALNADGTLAVGGGYGATGCTISTAGVLECNGAATTDGVLTANSGVITTGITIGGGYGSTGATISTAGVGQFNGALTSDGALTAASGVITAGATFGGGYGSTGCTISTAGLLQCNDAITSDGALTAASGVITAGATFGGGYGSTGCSVSTAGVLQCNDEIVSDGALTAASAVITAGATFGGGYGSTGCTITTAGVLQCNDAITSDGVLTVNSAVVTTTLSAEDLASTDDGSIADDFSVGGDTTLGGDVTITAESTGGNTLAVNQFIGVPRIALAGLGTMVNGTSNTVLADIGDSETPASDWPAIDGDVTVSNDSSYFRQGTASLKLVVATSADAGDGITNTVTSGAQDWSDDEGFGFWMYATQAITAGTFTLDIWDNETATSFNLPAYAVPDVWQWSEIDVTTANGNKDAIDALSIRLSAGGAVVASGGQFDVYFDFFVKWDVGEEETLGQDILVDGVMSLMLLDATSGAASSSILTLYSDYFVHYQTGNDAIVIITDQSDADKLGIALVAY